MAATLEDLLGEAQVKKLTGKKFPIMDVRIERDGLKYGKIPTYERDEFYEGADRLIDLGEKYGKLRENVNDMSALNDVIDIVSNYVPGDKKKMQTLMQENPHVAISLADSLYSNGEIALAKYVEKNKTEIFDKLNEKQLYSIFSKTPSYATGIKKYDRIKVLKEKMLQIQEVQEKGGDITRIVEDEYEQLLEKLSEGVRNFVESNADMVKPIIMQSLLHNIQKEFKNLFRDKKGNIDKDEIIDYLKANYEVVEDFIKDKVPKDKPYEKFDVWDKRLKPHYIALAQELYKPTKREVKVDRDKKKEKRKDEAKAAGFGY